MVCLLSHVLLFASSICVARSSCMTKNAGTCATLNGEEVSSLLQSKVAMQDAMPHESDAEVEDKVQGLSFSQEAINERCATRTRLIIKSDLSTLDEAHYRAFDDAASIDDNIKEAFDHFIKSSGLDQELTAEESDLFRARFDDELRIYLKHDDFDANKDHSMWLRDVAQSLKDEAPAVTEALINSINSADLGYKTTFQEWMKNLSKSDYDNKMGLQFSEDGSSFVQSSGKDAAHFDSLLEVDTPDAMDGRTKWPQCSEVIERIHNQGTCGSCWAFGAMSALDSRLCIKTNAIFSGDAAILSRGYATSCSYPPPKDGCGGGLMDKVYKMFKSASSGGVTGGSTGCSPYFGHGSGTEHFNSQSPAPPCPTQCADSYTQRTLGEDRYYFPDMTYRNLRGSTMMQSMKSSLYQDGPISYAIKADQPFMGYSGGVYRNSCPSGANHAVTAIGYGTDFITSLNSWGPRWGDRGGFKTELCNVFLITMFDFAVDTTLLPNPVVPGGTAGPTTQPRTTQAPPAGGSAWTVTSGPCSILEPSGCATSPGYPGQYGSSQTCRIETGQNSPPIEVEDFAVEAGYDKLTVNGVAYDNGNSIHGKVPSGGMTWRSDSSVETTGWKICPRTSPSPTTAAPTTAAPTTAAPTTAAPTTAAPTTAAPTTAAPTTAAPSDSVVVTRESLAHALETNIDDEFITKVMNSLR